VQHLDAAIGHYIVSDRPMTEEQWIAERTKLEPRQIESTAAEQAADVVPPLSDSSEADSLSS
jgi:hypothetical protein